MQLGHSENLPAFSSGVKVGVGVIETLCGTPTSASNKISWVKRMKYFCWRIISELHDVSCCIDI